MRRKPLVFFAVLLAAGLVATVAGALLDPRRLWFSWLAAFAFAVSTAAGALVLVAIAHAVRARWFAAVRRLAEIPMAALPIFLVLLVPILVGVGALYPWVHPDPSLPATELAAIEHRRGWLNPAFFAVRSVVWVGLWSIFAVVLGRWSLRQDASLDAALQGKLFRASAAALPLLALSITFASFDWLMSLQPGWLSTVFGIYWFSGGFAGALGLLAILLPLVGGEQRLENHRIAVGKLLLSMVIFWAYIAFMQLLLIWIADLPHEIDFFRRRSEGAWAPVTTVLALVHFVVPFLLLLSRALKKSARSLAVIGGIVLVGHWIDSWWLVLPVLDAEGPVLHLLDFGALATVAGAAGLFATWRLGDAQLFASGDPFFAHALRYRGS